MATLLTVLVHCLIHMVTIMAWFGMVFGLVVNICTHLRYRRGKRDSQEVLSLEMIAH